MAKKYISIIIADNGDITIKGVHDTKPEAEAEAHEAGNGAEGVALPSKVRTGSPDNGGRPFVTLSIEQRETGWELRINKERGGNDGD